MKALTALWIGAATMGLFIAGIHAEEEKKEMGIVEVLDIAEVPAGFPVGFSLLTVGNRQYVAYYAADHTMTVAVRELGETTWRHHTLDSRVGWDSHNYITMAVDDDGQLHLSGNMHVNPLVYFRTSAPGDITTFERIASMTGKQEARITYPKFTRDGQNRLIFHYRDGSSGSGSEIFNVYDPATKSWKRLLDRPLTDGRGRMNAYMYGPSLGPDGMFHLCWVWRNTPDCSTNHSPSYARSRDLITWESVDGQALELPITPDTAQTLIDPLPVESGIINGSLRIGFDSAHRAIASYHKFDELGNTQAYVARFQDGEWVRRTVSTWEYRWDFRGNGSIIFEISLGAVRQHAPNQLAMPYQHVKYGSGLLVFDEETLESISTEAAPAGYPAELVEPQSNFAGMAVRWAGDAGQAPDPASRYVLRWETLPHHRDRPRQPPLPAPSMLRLYQLSRPSATPAR